MARYSAGSFASAAAARRRLIAFSGTSAGSSALARSYCGQRTKHIALALENRANAGERSRVAGIDLDGLSIMLERIRRSDRPAARPPRDRDRGNRSPATRRSPGDRSRRFLPAARIGRRLSRAPACPASRGTSAHRRGCADRSATDPSPARLRSWRAHRRRDRARASPGRGRSAPAGSRHQPAARGRTAPPHPSRCRAPSRGTPSPSRPDEKTAAASTPPRTRARRCDDRRTAGIASRDRSARRWSGVVPCGTAGNTKSGCFGAPVTDGRRLRRARRKTQHRTRSTEAQKTPTGHGFRASVFRVRCSQPRAPVFAIGGVASPTIGNNRRGTSASSVARSPIVAWLCTVACR